MIDNLRDSKNNNSKQKSISVYKNRRNKKNKNGIGESDNQFLSIINEANDLIKSECKKRYCRPKSKNTNENSNDIYENTTPTIYREGVITII